MSTQNNNKGSLLKLVKQRRRESIDNELAVTNRNEPLVCSDNQSAMWLHWQTNPSSTEFNIPAIFKLTGDVDDELLANAWRQVCQRHESLRTYFADGEDGRGVQIISDQVTELEIIDLSNCSKVNGNDQEELKSSLEAMACTRFDLTCQPPVKAALFRVSSSESIIALVLHHIISDGWSMDIVFSELSQIYLALLRDTAIDLPPLKIQYADYAVWQRSQVSSRDYQEQWSYWSERLQDLTRLALPYDRAAPSQPSYLGQTVSFELPAELVSSLEALAQQEGVTLYMVLLGTYQWLLSRLSGQTDVCVGSTVANRSRAELESVVGFFANVLAMRVTVDERQSLAEYLQQVKQMCVSAFSRQSVSLYEVAEQAGVGRSGSRASLYQATFVLQNTHTATGPKRGDSSSSEPLDGLTVSPCELGPQLLPYELMLSVEASSRGGLVGHLSYQEERFSRQSMQRFGERYVQLLQQWVSAVSSSASSASALSQPLWRCSVLLPGEGLSGAVENIPSWEVSVPEVFNAVVERCAEQVAVVAESGERLDYRTLDTQSTQLARALQARGVQPGDWVGMCLPRSLDAVVSLLAILKAGAGYVPLAPNTPHERLLGIFEDAGLSYLLVNEAVLAELPAYDLMFMEVLSVDGERSQWQSESTAPLSVCRQAESLAYVTYTSGSTGQPKG
uniref:condensation domain-containing protein n=1 Tax=Pleionea sediminis TaxID=2569479 RepID=UPI001186E80A